MGVANPFATPAPVTEVARDRGRPLIRPVGGGDPVPYTRATTVAGAIQDMSGIMRWREGLVALGVASSDEITSALQDYGPDDTGDLIRLAARAAREAGAERAANLGTRIHEFTERIDLGVEVGNVPPEYVGDLDAYRARAAEIGWTVRDVEKFLVLHGYQVAGTADRVLEIDGRTYIADIKTGKSIHPHEHAAQLAIYARSLPFDLDTGVTTPWDRDPDTDWGLIIHMPAGKGRCDLHWIDLAAGWEAVQLAIQVRRWRSRRDLLHPWGTPIHDPITTAIRAARSETELNRIWTVNETTWTDEHTRLAAARKKTLTTR